MQISGLQNKQKSIAIAILSTWTSILVSRARGLGVDNKQTKFFLPRLHDTSSIEALSMMGSEEKIRSKNNRTCICGCMYLVIINFI